MEITGCLMRYSDTVSEAKYNNLSKNKQNGKREASVQNGKVSCTGTGVLNLWPVKVCRLAHIHFCNTVLLCIMKETAVTA
jgi:hypothetical protein